MALYFVSYDLRKQRDYQKLFDALQSLNAKRFLESDWCLLHGNTTCEAIRNYLTPFIDSDDAIMAAEVSDWASLRTLVTPKNL